MFRLLIFFAVLCSFSCTARAMAVRDECMIENLPAKLATSSYVFLAKFKGYDKKSNQDFEITNYDVVYTWKSTTPMPVHIKIKTEPREIVGEYLAAPPDVSLPREGEYYIFVLDELNGKKLHAGRCLSQTKVIATDIFNPTIKIVNDYFILRNK